MSENIQITEKGFFMINNKVGHEEETCCKNLLNSVELWVLVHVLTDSVDTSEVGSQWFSYHKM